MRYWPHPPVFLLLLLGAGMVAVAVIEVRAVSYAFTLTGLSPPAAGAVLVASMIGSGVNIPVARLESARLELEYRRVRAFGVVYLVPIGVPGHTTVAVNVGGAVVPTAVSAYLLWHQPRWADVVVAVAAVALVVHFAARPVRSVGIGVPMFVPALAAMLVAVLLRPQGGAPSLAYVAGTIGTLVGADLTHLGWARRMEAPVVSIGGAGTFDGVFVSGVLAVLLSAFW